MAASHAPPVGSSAWAAAPRSPLSLPLPWVICRVPGFIIASSPPLSGHDAAAVIFPKTTVITMTVTTPTTTTTTRRRQPLQLYKVATPELGRKMTRVWRQYRTPQTADCGGGCQLFYCRRNSHRWHLFHPSPRQCCSSCSCCAAALLVCGKCGEVVYVYAVFSSVQCGE